MRKAEYAYSGGLCAGTFALVVLSRAAQVEGSFTDMPIGRVLTYAAVGMTDVKT